MSSYRFDWRTAIVTGAGGTPSLAQLSAYGASKGGVFSLTRAKRIATTDKRSE